MRRISIDTLGMNASPRGSTFAIAKRRRQPWYLSRPRLLTTFLFFAALYLWLRFGETTVVIPEDSYALLEDETLRDILNTTLGFEKILVLNLPFRTDRRDGMTLAAAASNIKLDFVEGVTGDSINHKSYPPPQENIRLSAGIRGSWRTHTNALQRVVEQNLTTALIFEDDVDWDIRIRPNLQRFALASRFLSSTTDTLSSNPRYKIDHVPNTENPESAIRILSPESITETLPSLSLSSIHTKSLPYTKTADINSPYGNPADWDILWIGHCGAGFPRHPFTHGQRSSTNRRKSDITAANVVLTHSNDATVPQGKYLKAHPFQGNLDPLATAYPPHTRIYHRATGGELCTVAYAVSQRGARRLLHQFSLKRWNEIFDSAMGRWCASEDLKDEEKEELARKKENNNKEKENEQDGQHRLVHTNSNRGYDYSGEPMERVCLTSQPPIFAHHHPMEGESDIGGLGGGYARKFETKYLRYSVRINLERILHATKGKEWSRGGQADLVDQWPDTDE